MWAGGEGAGVGVTVGHGVRASTRQRSKVERSAVHTHTHTQRKRGVRYAARGGAEQHLEAEDVEQPDVAALTHACGGHECRVDERHDLVEDARVQRRRERVTRARRLKRRVGLAVGGLGTRREELLAHAVYGCTHGCTQCTCPQCACTCTMHMHHAPCTMHHAPLHTQCTRHTRSTRTRTRTCTWAAHGLRSWLSNRIARGSPPHPSRASSSALRLALALAATLPRCGCR